MILSEDAHVGNIQNQTHIAPQTGIDFTHLNQQNMALNQ